MSELPVDNGDGTYTYHHRVYRRVSTILKCGSKPALVPAAVKATAEHIRGLVEREQPIDWIDVKREYKRQWKRKADDGTVVHETVLRIVDGEPLYESDFTANQNAIIDGYYMWQRANAPRFLGHEVFVISETHDYAGRFDWYGYLGERLCLGDFKTGKDIWPETVMQLAAYANADYMIVNGEHVPLPAFDALVVVHLRPRFQDTLEVIDPAPAWEAFKGLARYAYYPHRDGKSTGQVFRQALPAATMTPLGVEAA